MPDVWGKQREVAEREYRTLLERMRRKHSRPTLTLRGPRTRTIARAVMEAESI